MSVSLDKVRKGDIVTTSEGMGVVTDQDRGYSASLVRMNAGPNMDDMDTSHGRWFGNAELKVVGYDPHAWVWFGARTVPASQIRMDKFNA